MDRDGVRVEMLRLGAPGRRFRARQPLRKGLGSDLQDKLSTPTSVVYTRVVNKHINISLH